MTFNTTGSGSNTQTGTPTFQPSDIKALVQKQGRTTVGNKDVLLKNPTASDAQLQEIVKDPGLSVKALPNSNGNGESEYELSANGKKVKITVAFTTTRQ